MSGGAADLRVRRSGDARWPESDAHRDGIDTDTDTDTDTDRYVNTDIDTDTGTRDSCVRAIGTA